jgi:membrane associated rhomboid family serine protease/Tfp pilus assembly protein PilF
MIPIGTDLQRRKFPAATLAIIGINILIFIYEMLMPRESLLWTFKNLSFGPDTRNPFSPFTSMFLHGSIGHISFNMLFLWIFGSPVEERIGSKLFLLYYFGAGLAAGIVNIVMEVIARPGSTIGAIGASGAISGIMALFLYRCYYSKLKMVINPILLPRQINIPVIPLVLIWLFQNVIMGIFSMSMPTGVAHWAHVGGFAFGIIIGRVKRYGHEGRIEQLRSAIVKKLEKGGGWKSAEKELLKLLKVAPHDAEVNHDLARLYAGNNENKMAERHFQAAIQRYFVSQPQYGAYAVLEYADMMSKPMELPYLLKATDALVKSGDYESAHKVLSPLMKKAVSTGVLAERSLSVHVRLCLHLNQEEDAREALQLFQENFPNSKYIHEINAALNKKAGEVFVQPALDSVDPAGTGNALEQKEADRLGIIAFLEQVFADPVFWSLLLFSNIASPILFPRLYFSPLSPVYLFVISFVMTIVHRMGSLEDLLSMINAPNEEKIRKEVAGKRRYDDAVMAERKENHSDAASLYEQVLADDPRNIQARFNVARLYHKKLDKTVHARKHYRVLKEHATKDHPFYHEAETALQELTKPGTTQAG